MLVYSGFMKLEVKNLITTEVGTSENLSIELFNE
jgi:hypothetical protein